ncbi:MAG: hypothetical protein HEQ32_03530 [Vampirovibrio sp.]
MAEATANLTKEAVNPAVTQASRHAGDLLKEVRLGGDLSKWDPDLNGVIKHINEATTNPETGESILKSGAMTPDQILRLPPELRTRYMLTEFTNSKEPLKARLDLSGMDLSGQDFAPDQTIKLKNVILDDARIKKTPQGLQIIDAVHTKPDATLTLEDVSRYAEGKAPTEGVSYHMFDTLIHEPGTGGALMSGSELKNVSISNPGIEKKPLLQIDNTQIEHLKVNNASVTLAQESLSIAPKSKVETVDLGRNAHLTVNAWGNNTGKPMVEKVIANAENTVTALYPDAIGTVSSMGTGIAKEAEKIPLNTTIQAEGDNAIQFVNASLGAKVDVTAFPSNNFDRNYSRAVKEILATNGATLKAKGALGDITGKLDSTLQINAKDTLGDVTSIDSNLWLEAKGKPATNIGGKEVPAKLLNIGEVRVDNSGTHTMRGGGVATSKVPTVHVDLDHVKTDRVAITGGINDGVSITNSTVYGTYRNDDGIYVSDLSSNHNNLLKTDNTITIEGNKLPKVQVTQNNGTQEFPQKVNINDNTTEDVIVNGNFNDTTVLRNHSDRDTNITLGASEQTNYTLMPSSNQLEGYEKVKVNGLNKGSSLDIKANPEKRIAPNGKPIKSDPFQQVTVDNSTYGNVNIETGSTRNPRIQNSTLIAKVETEGGIELYNVGLIGGSDITASNVTMKNPEIMSSLNISGRKEGKIPSKEPRVNIQADNLRIMGNNTQISEGAINGKKSRRHSRTGRHAEEYASERRCRL